MSKELERVCDDVWLSIGVLMESEVDHASLKTGVGLVAKLGAQQALRYLGSPYPPGAPSTLATHGQPYV